MEERVKKIKTNLLRVRDNLISLGFIFDEPLKTIENADTSIDHHINKIETDIVKLPEALKQFYRHVGSIDFTGSHPDWSCNGYVDAVFVYPLSESIAELEEYKELDDPKLDYWGSDNGTFRLVIAPDQFHKEDVSGGMWYGVEVPNLDDDPLLLEEPHGISFLDYLELAISFGGFPGLDYCTEHTWPMEYIKKGVVPN